MANMRKYTKMLVAANMLSEAPYSRTGSNEGRMENNRGRMGYPENRMEYGGGRMEGGYNRMEGGYGRMEYPSMEMNSTHGNRSDERERMPRYNDGRYEDRNQGDDRVRPRAKIIGFQANDNEMDYNYRTEAGYYPRSEGSSYQGRMQGKGGASSSGGKLTKEMAHEWVKNMENEDGSKGPHFTTEQVKRVAEQRGGNVDLLRQWVAMNAMYSDYCAVLNKYGVNLIDAYYDMAEAFVNDKDAGARDKLATYYECIVNGG